MATHDYNIANASGSAVRTDLNNVLAAIVSNNSNATEPATTFAFQWWADTTANVLKLRNAANDAWVEIIQLDGEFTSIGLEDGSAASPSLFFKDSGTDTGLFSSAADEVAISTGGTQRVTTDSSGRLLVGTSTARTYSPGVPTKQVFQVETAGSSSLTTVGITSNSDSAAGGSYLCLARSRGTTLGSETLVANNDVLGAIRFDGTTGSGFTRGAAIFASVDGTPGASDLPTRLVFSTTADGASSSTERMRITNGGRVGIDDNTAGYAEMFQVDATNNTSSAYVFASKVGTTGSAFHTRFGDTTGVIGSITSSGGTVSYNPFLGSHWGRLENNNREDIPVGTILETVDKEIEWNFAVFEVDEEIKKIAWNGTEAVGSTVEVEFENEIYQATIEPEFNPKSESEAESVLNKHVCVKVSDTPNSPCVFGVFLHYDTDEGSLDFIGSWNDLYVAAIGNFFIRIDKDETVAMGDLITSGGNGCGIVQQSDAITNKTVAKVTSTKKHKIYEDGSYIVTCVLYCG